jgi:hypothetical protein
MNNALMIIRHYLEFSLKDLYYSFEKFLQSLPLQAIQVYDL